MPDRTRRDNAVKSAVRSKVEHVFAHQKGLMGLGVRTIGLARQGEDRAGQSRLQHAAIGLAQRQRCARIAATGARHRRSCRRSAQSRKARRPCDTRLRRNGSPLAGSTRAKQVVGGVQLAANYLASIQFTSIISVWC